MRGLSRDEAWSVNSQRRIRASRRGINVTTTTVTAGMSYDYSFQLRNDNTATADSFGIAHRIRIGGTDAAPIIQFQVFDNGVLQYNDGGTSVSVNNVNGNRLDLDDLGSRFITIEGTIDFTADTYDVIVDGVVQGTDLSLVNAPSTFGQVTLQFGNSSSDPVYRQISIDNLEIAVPEPGSLGLIGLGGLMLLRRKSS